MNDSKDNLRKILTRDLKIDVGDSVKIRKEFKQFLSRMKKFDKIKEEATYYYYLGD